MSTAHVPGGVGSRVRVSQNFCASDAEVSIRSSDGVLFKVHRKNLETHAQGFPPSDFEILDEEVHLSEDSSTLELLFHFIYPIRQSDHSLTPFASLYSLAEAAEKYEVFSAMNICKIRIQTFLPQYIDEIVTYAVKHDYPDIVQEAVPLMVERPLQDILEKLPSNLILPWIRYYDQWTRILQSAATFHKEWVRDQVSPPPPPPVSAFGHSAFGQPFGQNVYQQNSACPSCGVDLGVRIVGILSRMVDVGSLLALDETFQIGSNRCSHSPIQEWYEWISQEIRSVKSFQSFL